MVNIYNRNISGTTNVLSLGSGVIMNDRGYIITTSAFTDEATVSAAMTDMAPEIDRITAAYRRLYSHHHLQHYSRRSIREILVRSGFDVQEHRCHNYPLAAVDVPAAGPLVEAAYRAFVGLVFLVSDPLGLGIEHTVFCRPAAPR